jgi:hypothetical protein
MVKAKRTTTMAQQGTNRISKSAKLEAARERARVAMEADLAKVEALQRKNTTRYAATVTDTSRPNMTAKTVSSQGYQLPVATTRVFKPTVDRPNSRAFEMPPLVKNDTMAYECANPQCRRAQRAIAKESARAADAARAHAARLYQAILFLVLILVALSGRLSSGHQTTHIGKISEHGHLNKISESKPTVTVLPHSTTNLSQSKQKPAALPDPQMIACSSVCRLERGLQSNLSGGWTLLAFALPKVAGIAWSCIYDYPSLSFGAIMLWLLRRFFYRSSYRSRMFVIAAQCMGGLGWTCLSIYPRHTSAVLGLLVSVVLAVKLRRSY